MVEREVQGRAHLGQANLVDELEEDVDVDRVAEVPLRVLIIACVSLRAPMQRKERARTA